VTAGLVVAVTGPTGTLGSALIPCLEADDRVARIVGVARRPFDPRAQGWAKMTYRRGDVRDPAALDAAFAGADVVVHLAFVVLGAGSAGDVRSVNIDGTLNVVDAAARAGARRLVYASSVAAYGFHPDNPAGMTEEWPVRPAAHFFYAREKAELEQRLAARADELPGLDLFVTRPSIVVGPHTVGAKARVPRPVAALGRLAGAMLSRAPRPLPVPVPVPDLPIQLVHEDDVASALVLCAVGAGPPGAYNLAGDGVVAAADLVREVGLIPVTVPRAVVAATARPLSGLAALPLVPPFVTWAEVLTHPAVMDTSKARRDLGWRPRYSGLDALRAALGRPA
jgi:nucleoside-diphosphate-sugar epimerase